MRGGPAFAQLIFMFTITPHNDIPEQKLALIQYYHPSEHPQASDTIIGFKRLCLSPPNMSQVISLESVIRGAYIVSAFEGGARSHEYFANDLIDGDLQHQGAHA
jgi:hypothetical protein